MMRIIKRDIIILLCITMMLSACSRIETFIKQHIGNKDDELMMEFLVGTSAAYPPYNFRDEKGQPIGFDIDIMNAIGEKNHFKFIFIPEPASEVLTNLDNNKYKVAISGFVRTAARKKKYQVSNTYAYGQDVIATLGSNPNPPQRLVDLRTRKTITLRNTNYVKQLTDVIGKNNPNIIQVDSGYFVIAGLIAGDTEAAFIDKGVAQYYAKSFPDTPIQMGGRGSADFDKYEMVILAQKSQSELMKRINSGLEAIVKDGTYQQIYKKWFGEEPKLLPPIKKSKK